MRRFALHLTMLTALLILMGGCHYHSADYSKRELMPLPSPGGQAGSLALSSPYVRFMQLTDAPPPPSPWYDGRRDVGPFALADAPAYSQSITVTRDRQYTINGRVYDRYDQRTYRRTIGD